MIAKFSISDLLVCNHNKISPNSTINIENGIFTNQNQTKNNFSLKNYIAYPGLINAHDHLLGSYFPKVGNGPYLNWKPWDDDLKESSLYQERKNLSVEELYQLGNYRQILSATTTVCDHIPHNVNNQQINKSFIRIIKQYCLAHEISSYELPWGRDHEVEIKEAKAKNIPFITHIEEGFDPESLQGIDILNQKGGVFENSVLVHCISCSIKDISLIAQKKASIVWCPVSNIFMFNKTANIKEFIDQEVNVCLGTDSPMSGAINLLEELKFAKSFFKKEYSADLSDQFLMKMVTTNPAKAFKLDKKLGQIKSGFLADFFLVKENPKHNNCYETLMQSKIENVAAVFKEGAPLFFQEELKELLPLKDLKEKYQKVRISSGDNTINAYLIGAPLALKKKIIKKLNFDKQLPFFPIH